MSRKHRRFMQGVKAYHWKMANGTIAAMRDMKLSHLRNSLNHMESQERLDITKIRELEETITEIADKPQRDLFDEETTVPPRNPEWTQEEYNERSDNWTRFLYPDPKDIPF